MPDNRNRKRPIQVKFFVDEKEQALIKKKMEQALIFSMPAPSLRVRVNTNGLSDLVNGRPTAALFAGKVDCLSISLNTDDPAEYLAVCRPKFGADAYPAMLAFAHDAVQCVPEVVMTVVGEPVTDAAKQARCRAIAEGLGARLRVRPWEG